MFIMENMRFRGIRSAAARREIRTNRVNVGFREFGHRWQSVVNGEYTCLVVDFDGTLRETGVRRGPIDPVISTEICRIGADKKTELCIATGRRSSAMELSEELLSKGLDSFKVILGNGSKIVSYPSKEVVYSANPFSSNDLREISQCLMSSCDFDDDEIFISEHMIRIFAAIGRSIHDEVRKATAAMSEAGLGCEITHSGINIEIVPEGTRKDFAVRELLGEKATEEVLAIGDSCSKDGNDFGLLAGFPSFCVGLESCKCLEWTLPVINDSGRILTGPAATRYLLTRFKTV